jgi:muconolactone delta-isomerase
LLRVVFAALPLRPWLEIETVPLSRHPNDAADVGMTAGRPSGV